MELLISFLIFKEKLYSSFDHHVATPYSSSILTGVSVHRAIKTLDTRNHSLFSQPVHVFLFSRSWYTFILGSFATWCAISSWKICCREEGVGLEINVNHWQTVLTLIGSTVYYCVFWIMCCMEYHETNLTEHTHCQFGLFANVPIACKISQ